MARKPAAPSNVASPLVLVCGEESVLVRQRARQVFGEWCAEVGGMDHERIDATAANTGEALRALGRLREALQTLPFFGSGKVVWFESCTFLGDDRTSEVTAVTEALAELAGELTGFDWRGVQLLISAGKVDKRRTFYKTIEKIGRVEEQAGLSASMKDWERRAEALVQERGRESGKEFAFAATAALVTAVGPNLGQLFAEVDKLATYVGDRARVEASDVGAVAVRNKQSRAFALGDALGERDLAGLLRTLDEALWEARGSGDSSGIGVLYGLIAKVRAMLLAKELTDEGLVNPEAGYSRFKTQLERLPVERFASDRRFNPRLINPYVIFRAAEQARHYTREELVQGLERLMECGLDLMSSTMDEGIVLQRAVVGVCVKERA